MAPECSAPPRLVPRRTAGGESLPEARGARVRGTRAPSSRREGWVRAVEGALDYRKRAFSDDHVVCDTGVGLTDSMNTIASA